MYVRIRAVFDHMFHKFHRMGVRAGALKKILSFLAGKVTIQQDGFYFDIVSDPALLEVIQAESICKGAFLGEMIMD